MGDCDIAENCAKPFFNTALACCMDVCMVSVHTRSNETLKNYHSHRNYCLLSMWKRATCERTTSMQHAKPVLKKVLPKVVDTTEAQ